MQVSGDNNVIGGSTAADRNVISANNTGIQLNAGANFNIVRGNYIGTDVTGNVDLGNTLHGINNLGANNTIGGVNEGEANVISGNNGSGIRSTAVLTLITGNYIGTNSAGTADLGNSQFGLDLGGSGTAGGASPEAGNVISGNDQGGVTIFGGSGVTYTFRGNYIGTDKTGILPVANSGPGILLNSPGNTVGSGATITAGAANTVAYNTGDGVRVSAYTGNSIRGNSIHSNGGLGINLVGGGNGELAAPVITAAGSASGTACANCTVDVYSDDGGQGRVYHGSTVADGSGNWSFGGAVDGPNVTATATDGLGNTSEFSAPFCISDQDADGVCDPADNCPYWPNPTQALPPWPVPANDPDCDGWSSPAEETIGTDPLQACGVAAWPPDLNNDTLINIQDILEIPPHLGKTSSTPGWDPRYDLNANTLVNIEDVLAVVDFLGKTCVV